MALCLRKEIKKSSYYVWFLGAKESKGLRGSEFVLPVIQHLVEREKEVEPFKVTLQISHKGLKIVQNIVAYGKSKPKIETIKHCIPHNTITCVYQQEDIIACILLLFNPVTKCPLHVHAYRCDSVETATLLKQQLNILIERPENQNKFDKIENVLKTPITKEVKKVNSLSSDTASTSESSEERFSNDRVSMLYDSVAAELRAKLKKNNEPILLPPRDYDTVHRQKGNLTGIELRRCLNANIVGQSVKNGRKIESGGASSGIGSDLPPSSESPDASDPRFNTLDKESTSDEEWNTNTADSTYIIHRSSPDVSLSRSERLKEEKHKYSYERAERKKYSPLDDWNEQDRRYSREKFIENLYEEEEEYEKPVPKPRQSWHKKIQRPDSGISYSDKFSRSTEYLLDERKRAPLRQRTPSPENKNPRTRFKDAKEKFLLLEKVELRKEPPISQIRKERYYNQHDRYDKYFEEEKPEPAPRSLQYQKEERYKYDPKCRSMFCLVEEEHKNNSKEIAQELKRRFYVDNGNYDDDFYRNKDEQEYIRSQKSRNAAGYRHSYAEPKMKLEKSKKNYPDMLQRTNSSVSNSGRVGLASIHPY